MVCPGHKDDFLLQWRPHCWCTETHIFLLLVSVSLKLYWHKQLYKYIQHARDHRSLLGVAIWIWLDIGVLWVRVFPVHPCFSHSTHKIVVASSLPSPLMLCSLDFLLYCGPGHPFSSCFPSSLRRRILLSLVELFPNLPHASSWGRIQALEWWVFLCINLSPVQLHFPRHSCAVTSLHWSSALLLFLVVVNICIATNLFTLELWAHWFSYCFKWGKCRACRNPCTCSKRNYWTPHGAAKQN